VVQKEGNIVSDAVGTGVGSDWKRFLRKHWGMVAVFVVAAILAFAGAVYVFLWYVGNAQSTGLVPRALSLWTMSNLVNFILKGIFWELLLIGIPVVVAGVAGWLWWRRLPAEEQRGYRFFGRRTGRTRGGGGVSLFFFIAFCIKVYLDGNWNIPISTWTLDYVVGSMVLILEWSLIVLGIPAAIAVVWWMRHEMKKP
jgi:hypothetical protein